MKILQLITTLNPGGAENHLLMLCRGLKARDHEVEVAYLLPGYNHLVREFERSGIPVHALNMHSRYDWSVVRRTAALLSRGQYDVVHTHLIRADYVGAAARLWARLPGRLVSSKHNDDWFYKTIPVALLNAPPWLAVMKDTSAGRTSVSTAVPVVAKALLTTCSV